MRVTKASTPRTNNAYDTYYIKGKHPTTKSVSKLETSKNDLVLLGITWYVFFCSFLPKAKARMLHIVFFVSLQAGMI